MPDFWTAAAVYLILINGAAVFPVFLDKRRARRGQWRVPERVFFILSALGGTCGTYLAMRAAHHKTKHKRFMIGFPLLFAAQLALAVCLFVRFGG